MSSEDCCVIKWSRMGNWETGTLAHMAAVDATRFQKPKQNSQKKSDLRKYFFSSNATFSTPCVIYLENFIYL
jgi:hypothetical protein